MKKIKLSLAALTLVLAIAGTSTANASKAKEDVDLCSVVDPGGTECNNETMIDCCEDDNTGQIRTAKNPIIPPVQ
jgi:hypothetical protein